MAKNKAKTIYTCTECGAQYPKWQGQCRECGAWNTLVEDIQVPTSPSSLRGWTTSTDKSLGDRVVFKLDQNPKTLEFGRTRSGYLELDRVLGGGFVKGSFILLGGDPGIGKSTLLLQMAGGISAQELKVLYVSGEESIDQTAMRAQRLGVRSSYVSISSESQLEVILEIAQREEPHLLVVDSIQTVFLSEITSAPGSVSQVRECAARLMALAKNKGIIVVLIGHVTKDGHLAGPKVLEHMVDTVLSFEGDNNHQFRLLRSLKNRFGPTHELGVFTMDTSGLREVSNPSELFLEERSENVTGSTVFASIEGTRPLLCEVQALTNQTPMAMPRRTSLGFDVNRVHLLVAVLNKHLALNLAHSDVFVNVVGGLKLAEPAADLAVASALISSDVSLEIPSKTLFFGEIGLTGEVRPVPFPDLRVKEGIKLGFKNFVLPASSAKHLKDFKKGSAHFHYVKDVDDLYSWLRESSQRRSYRKVEGSNVKSNQGAGETRSTPASLENDTPNQSETTLDEIDF